MTYRLSTNLFFYISEGRKPVYCVSEERSSQYCRKLKGRRAAFVLS
jgi:hypothetical protein